MSVEAITWVLKDAPDVPPQLVSTLIGLANHASPDGRNAYPSQGTLARYTRKDERTVRRDLAKLVDIGLIQKGDQRIVDHLPKDRRPVVYDLAVWRRMDLDGGTPTSGRTSTPARTPTSERGDAHVLPGGTPTSPRGGTPTSAKPSYEPSVEPSGNQERRGPARPAASAAVQDPRPDGLTSIPDDFAPTDSMRRWAVSTFGQRIDVNFETSQFVSHYRSTGARRKSWPDAWQKWVRDSDRRISERGPARASPNGRRRSTKDDAFTQHQELRAELFGPGTPPPNLVRGELT